MEVRVFLGLFFSLALLDSLVSSALFTCGFTSDLWFHLGNYSYLDSVLELFLLGLLRSAVLAGVGGGLALRAAEGRRRLGKTRLGAVTVGLAMASYSPFKLLVLDEVPGSLAASPLKWALLAWNFLAALAFAALWVLGSTVEEEKKPGEGDEERLLDGDVSRSNASLKEGEKEKLGLAKSAGILRRLLSYCKVEWPLYLAGFCFLFIYSTARIFIPYYMAQVISTIVITHSYEDLKQSILIMCGLSLASALFGGLRGGCFSYAIARVARAIRGDLFTSLTSQEIGFFDTTKTGELTSRLTADCQTMTETVGLNVNVLLRNLVMFIGSLAVMVKLSWQMTMITFIVIPLIGLISKVYGAYYDRLSEETQSSLAKANEVAEEVLGAMRTVRSFAAEETEAGRYGLRLDHVLGIKLKQTYAYVGYVWSNETFDLLILSAVLWYGGHLVIEGRMTSQNLISFLLYQLQLGECLITMGSVWTGLMLSVGASRKVFQYIDRKPQFRYDGTQAPKGTFNGTIAFRDVCFAYPSRPDKVVIKVLIIPG